MYIHIINFSKSNLCYMILVYSEVLQFLEGSGEIKGLIIFDTNHIRMSKSQVPICRNRNLIDFK